MALVGHISGSTQSNSLIAVSGTVIIANRPDALFPASLPGADVSFFVSGTLGGKGVAERTVSLFGGDVVVSGSLTVGSGTLKVTSNDLQFGSFANRIELNGSDIKFFDGNNLAGRTLAALITSAGGSDTQVQFNNAGSLDGSSAFTFASAAGRASVTHVSVGTSLTASIIKAGGATVSLFDDTATTINFGAGASSALNIGPAGGVTTISGDLKISGNDIKSSDNATAISLSSADVSVAGALGVGTTLGVTGAATLSSTLGVTGAATLSSTLNAGASTLASLSVTGNAIISGDLTVNGTMATVNTTNLEIKDSVIGLGFSSGTIAVAAGDRGWIGGLAEVNNVMSKWDNTASEFAFARTTSSATGSFGIASYANLHANNIQGNIVSASLGFSGSHTKLMDGTSAFIAGTGVTISSASNGAVTISGGAGGGIGGSDTQIQFNDAGAFAGDAGLTYNKTTDTLTILGDLAVNGGDLTSSAATFNLLSASVTTLNLACAATSLLVGATACAMAVGGVASPSSTITAATGSFGRVLASSTSTFTGATTHNGGITGTTLALSSNATVLGTLAATGNITGTGTSNQLNALAVTGSIGLSVTSGVTVGTTLGVTGAATFNGAVTLGDAGADTITYNGQVGSNILPYADRLYNLGSPSYRWANIYTGDLHLRNERGNWTVIEEETYLSIRNNHTGKMFKFVLEEVSELIEE